MSIPASNNIPRSHGDLRYPPLPVYTGNTFCGILVSQDNLTGGKTVAKPKGRDTQQVNLHLPPEIVAAVEEYRFTARLESKTAAYETLLRKALGKPDPPPPRP